MLSEKEKCTILELIGAGNSIRQIAKELGIPYTTTRDFVAKYKKTGSIARQIGSGRPTLLNKSEMHVLAEIKEKNHFLSPCKLIEKLHGETSISVSTSTMRNYLKNIGYFAGKMIFKPKLTGNQKSKRFAICKSWSMKSIDFWDDVIFSDETKFNLKNSDGQSFIWKRRGESLSEKNVRKTVKFGGGSVMFWGCFSKNGVGMLTVVDGIMDRYAYVNILRHNLNKSAEMLQLGKYKFQQDNDPKHTSHHATQYFQENNVDVIMWPSQSPDLNPIENLWASIKKKLKGKDFSKKEKLIECVNDIWRNISPEVCKKLVGSMDDRIIQVLRSEGGYSDY